MPPATRTKLEDHVITTTGNLTLATGKRMYKFEAKRNSAELKYVTEGESGGKSIKASIEAYFAGFSSKLHGFISTVKNKDLVLLVKVGDDWHLLGTEDYGAEIETFEGATGKNTTDAIGANFMISIAGLDAATIYKGEIDHLLEKQP